MKINTSVLYNAPVVKKLGEHAAMSCHSRVLLTWEQLVEMEQVEAMDPSPQLLTTNPAFINMFLKL